MRRLGAVLSLGLVCALGACYSPGYVDCQVTCASQVCPSGYSCLDGFCREPNPTQSCSEVLGDAGINIEIDAPADRDGDRVPDSVDNCPEMSNPAQYDEDGDVLGDDCDPCPIVAGVSLTAAAVDSDGDTIGDACDPRPNMTGDVLIAFYDFNEAPPGMMNPGNTVSLFTFDGRATATPVSDSSANATWSFNTLAPNSRPYVIRTQVTLIDLGADPNTHGAGLFDGVEPDGHGLGCILGLSTTRNPPQGLHAVEVQAALDQAQSSADTQPPVANGATIPLSLLHPANAGGNWLCSTSPTTTIPAQAPLFTTTMALGLHTRSVRAAWDYLYVVDSPSGP